MFQPKLPAKDVVLTTVTDQQQKDDAFGKLPDKTGMQREIVGSFNAAAISAQGGGASQAEKQVEELRKANDQRQRLIDLQRDTLHEIRNGGAIV